jgi:uncharacterized protein
MAEPVRQGSHFQYDVVVERNVKVPARDGVELATDLYFPALNRTQVAGRFPVILERTPYLKRSTRYFRKGSFYARHGYVMAVQDVRGRGASRGTWYPFAEEAEDGYDAVEWLAAQPWANGKVGTLGTSYAGSDQSALATLCPPHLACQFIAMGASNYHDCSMRHNGCLEQRFLIYAFRMAVTSREAEADPAVKAALVDAFENIGQWMRELPLRKGATPLALVPNLEQWALDIQNRADYDEYWRKRGLSIEHYWDEQADVPTVFLGGWYDSYARATTTNFVELSKRKTSPMYLVMGPWTHGDPTCEVSHSGEVDFGPEAALDVYHRSPLKFFDTHLKGLATGLESEPRVRIFVMGPHARTEFENGRRNEEGRRNHGGRWRMEKSWPLERAKDTPWYLHADGRLSPEQPPAGADPAGAGTTFRFDPRDPVPTIGGGLSAGEPLLVPGAFDQRGNPPGASRSSDPGRRYPLFARPEFYGSTSTLPLAARDDVLVFQTGPLTDPVEVTGPILARLWISSSAVDTDFTVKLVDVAPPSADYPHGFAMLLTDSIQRCRYRSSRERAELMTPGEVCRLEFPLYPTSNVFAAGHRIRVDVSSSNWPRFDVNPNTGEPLGRHRGTQTALNTVFHTERHASCVVLPVVHAT